MTQARGRKGLVAAAVALSLVMLALIAGTLARLLFPPEETPSLLATPADGTPEDAMLGLVLIDITDEDTAAFYHVAEQGVYVLAVDESSPAYLAGVRSGDRIVAANGVPVDASGELTAIQAALPVGERLVLLLSRGAEGLMLTVALGAGADIAV